MYVVATIGTSGMAQWYTIYHSRIPECVMQWWVRPYTQNDERNESTKLIDAHYIFIDNDNDKYWCKLNLNRENRRQATHTQTCGNSNPIWIQQIEIYCVVVGCRQTKPLLCRRWPQHTHTHVNPNGVCAYHIMYVCELVEWIRQIMHYWFGWDSTLATYANHTAVSAVSRIRTCL